MAVTTIKSTDSLEVESVRAGGVGRSLDGVEVRSVAAGSCLCSVGNPPGSAGVPPASLYLQTACHPRPLPCKAHQTRLYGDALPSCRSLCGRDARAPGWGLCGRDARAPGGSFFTSRNASTASMAKGGADGRNDHQIDRLAGGRIRARWRSWHVTGWRRSPKCCGGLLFVFGGQSTRERGRPARILIPANSLPSKATPLQGAPNPPLRGSLPSCRSLCGRDARAPRWSLCGRDARAPGWSFFTSRSASTARMAKRGADGRNDHQIDLLAGGGIRARWRSWHVTGWRRSPKCCGGFLFVFGGQSTRERGRPARILIPANSLPSKATPLQGAPNPPLRGALPSCRGLCGRDARAPGWSLCGRDARAPGWGLCGRDARAPGWSLCGRDARAPGGSFFTSRSASTASMAKGGADGRNDHQIDRLAGGRIRARWRSWHVTGWRRSPKCCGGFLFVFGGAIHPGARASRPHPYTCKQPAIQGHSLARRTKPAFTGFSSILPGFVRAGRPRSRVGFVRAGRPRSQVGFVRARRPRSRVVFVRARRPRSQVVFTPSPRPTLGGSLSSILQRLSGPLAVLRAPSWITLFAFL